MLCMNKRTIALVVAGVLALASIILDQLGLIEGLKNGFFIYILISVLIIAIGITSKNRGILMASIVFGVALSVGKIISMGYIPLENLSIKYFSFINIVLPGIILGIAIWQKKWTLVYCFLMLFASFFISSLVKSGLVSPVWSWVSLGLSFVGTLWITLWSSNFEVADTKSKYLAVVGPVFAVFLATALPIEGPFTTTALILSIIASSLSCFFLVQSKGGILAVSAMLLAISWPIMPSNYWFGWLPFIFEISAFLCIGIYLAQTRPQKELIE